MTSTRTAPTLAEALGFRISRVARLRRQQWARQLQTLDLTTGEAAVLRALVEAPGIALRPLTRLLGSEVMKVRRSVDALERRGLVRTAADPDDQRLRTLWLTADGRTTARRVQAIVDENEAVLAQVLGDRGYRDLMRLLDRLEPALLADDADDPTTTTAR